MIFVIVHLVLGMTISSTMFKTSSAFRTLTLPSQRSSIVRSLSYFTTSNIPPGPSADVIGPTLNIPSSKTIYYSNSRYHRQTQRPRRRHQLPQTLGYSTTRTILRAHDDPTSKSTIRVETTTDTTNSSTSLTNDNDDASKILSSESSVERTLSKKQQQQQQRRRRKRRRSGVSRTVRQGLAGIFSATGFVISSTWSIVRNPQRFLTQTQQPLLSFWEYLQSTGIRQEIGSSLQSRSLALSLSLLRRVHDEMNQHHHYQQQQDNSTTSRSTVIVGSKEQEEKDPEPNVGRWRKTDLQRFIRFATAVYGPAMIRGATIDVGGQGSSGSSTRGTLKELAGSVGLDTMTIVSNHMRIPLNDIVIVQIDDDYYSPSTTMTTTNETPPSTSEEEQASQDTLKEDVESSSSPSSTHPILRHLVAVDHEHKQVVLVLRGTFSLQEVVVDIVSFTRENFCSIGQAHEGMATMAEAVWKTAGPTIVDTLQSHPEYEFIIVGHSLGAGTACLLTIMLLETPGLFPSNIPLHCIAFAGPPIFTFHDDDEAQEQQRQASIPSSRVYPITNVIHEYDVVPFLSVHSVRYLLASLLSIRMATKELSWSKTFAILTGSEPVPQSLLDCIPDETAIPPKPGAPKLYIPAEHTLWLRQNNPRGYDDVEGDSTYDENEKEGHLNDDEEVTYVSELYHDPLIQQEKDGRGLGQESRIPWTIHIHPKMLSDHFPSQYEYALNRWRRI